MRKFIILKILGTLLAIFSFSLLPPIAVGLYYNENDIYPFAFTFFLTFNAGIISWYISRNHHSDLHFRDGFIVVAMFWTVLGLAGALPFALSTNPHISYTNAVFESLSGLTTTGATILTEIDTLPHSILFYRQQLQWLGGMGIIVLAVAVLPMLGIGGMQLYKAEAPGPVKDNKLAPRITETAKALWYIYLGLTISCSLAYLMAGMSLFDAICHSFSTVAIGGFSTHDQSLGFYNTPMIEYVAILFMFLAGINFSMHFLCLKHKTIRAYIKDTETKVYISMLFLLSMIMSLHLFLSQEFNLQDAFRYGIFQTVSFATTTGFTTHANYANWPDFLPVLLIFMSFIGGCAGSTGGGIKVIRFILLFKQGYREVLALIHPNAILSIKLGKYTLSNSVISAVWGFFAIYTFTFIALMLLLMLTGLDQVSAFSAVAACLNNLGPGLGKIASNYKGLSDSSKWLLSFAMLLGRLEIFTILVLLTPEFWRK